MTMLATFAALSLLCLPPGPSAPQSAPDLRAPSVPLVVHDPYFSIWLPHDKPTDGWPTHWTGRVWPMCSKGAVKLEQKIDLPATALAVPPKDLPALAQSR